LATGSDAVSLGVDLVGHPLHVNAHAPEHDEKNAVVNKNLDYGF
jgi:hypothetical protein